MLEQEAERFSIPFFPGIIPNTTNSIQGREIIETKTNQSNLITVVIPTRNRSASVRQLLQSLLECVYLPLEIIVVDQSNDEHASQTELVVSTAAAQANLAFSSETDLAPVTQPGFIRYIRTRTLGAGICRNTGARVARGAVVLFTDDDCIVSPNWVEVMEQDYIDHPELVGIYGRILPAAQLRNPEGYRPNGTEPSRVSTDWRLYDRPVSPWHIGSGANMSFRRLAFLEAGEFDEVLAIGGPLQTWEDLDISYRMLHNGNKIAYNGQSLIYHDSVKNFAEQVTTEKSYGRGIGAAVTKYVRCGNYSAILMLFRWYWHMAIRRAGAGVFKWHSWRVVKLALVQFWVPLLGVFQALDWPIDKEHQTFLPKSE